MLVRAWSVHVSRHPSNVNQGVTRSTYEQGEALKAPPRDARPMATTCYMWQKGHHTFDCPQRRPTTEVHLANTKKDWDGGEIKEIEDEYELIGNEVYDEQPITERVSL